MSAVEDADGAALLDDVDRFLARFVVYPSDYERTAHVLWIGHTWFMDAWESTPRLAFLSPEPGSGKSRALEVTEPLVPRPIHAVNTTPAYLFRKVSDEAGPPTILYDEIDTVFGPRAKDNEDTRGMLNAGHRKGALAGRCVVRGNTVETEELPAYCAVALAGLNDLPDTLMSRSVVVRMRRRAPGERVEPWRLRTNGPEARALGERLREWSNAVQHTIRTAWPAMPAGVEDRNADLWEALLAVADCAGGAWPTRGRVAAVALVADPRGKAESLGVLLLRDLRTVFTEAGTDKLSTETILEDLCGMDESPWGDLRGKPLDARALSRRLSAYDVKPHTLRIGEKTPKGYDAADLADPWSRYLPETSSASPQGSATSATSATVRTVPSVPTVPEPDGSEPNGSGGSNGPNGSYGTETRTGTPDGAFRPTALMERVSRRIEMTGRPMSGRDFEAEKMGKAAYVRQAVAVLVAEGYLATAPGARGATLHTLVKPFRETSESDGTHWSDGTHCTDEPTPCMSASASRPRDGTRDALNRPRPGRTRDALGTRDALAPGDLWADDTTPPDPVPERAASTPPGTPGPTTNPATCPDCGEPLTLPTRKVPNMPEGTQGAGSNLPNLPYKGEVGSSVGTNGEATQPTEPPDPPPADAPPPRPTKTCRACGLPMTDVGDGATTHPNCDPTDGAPQ